MRLLEPLALRGRTAPNRLMFGPHETNLGWDRSLGERHVAYYERRARGGAGIVVVEEASVHASDWPYERAPLAESCAPGWAAVARSCRTHGALVLAALGHSGGQGSSAYSQSAMWAPSGVPEVNTREVPKVMETDDIEAVVAGFRAAAAAAVDAGLDGVEVNAGQHSLVRQFLSGLTNQRADGYGSDRSRFAREVLAAVRDGAGPDAVLGLRLSCDELAPWAGITPEAAAGLATELASLVDYLVVVRGAIFSVASTRPDGHDPAGFNLELTRQIRDALAGAVPVFAQGSIVDADQAEWALGEGMADAVEMTRAQIADPDLGAKLAAGAPERIRPCVLCNQRCKVRDNRNPLVSCVVEPSAGYEWSDPPSPPVADAAPAGPAPAEAVLVVGGGVSGLEAARSLASAGAEVTLRERSPRLGGAALVAAKGAGRARLWSIAAWLEAECRRLGVRLETGVAVTPDDVAAWPGPVIVATGGVDRDVRADYTVAGGASVSSAADVLSRLDAPPPGPGDDRVATTTPGARRAANQGPVLVWDPIGGPVGVSVAESLAAAGRTVHLATPDFIVGTMLSMSGDLAPANTRLHQAGVTLHKRVLLREVRVGSVVVEDRFSAERREVDVDQVVDAGHRLGDATAWPDSALSAGDVVAPRSLYEAVLEGRRAAQAVVAGGGMR